MKLSTTIGVFAALSATMAWGETDGRQLAGLAFDSTDGNSDGFISMEEYQKHMDDVFFSMDNDENKELTWNEFRSWGFGMENIAEDVERLEAYDTARKIVFDLWDRSFDWKVDPAEQRRGVAFDFFGSDENRDGRLSKDEYLKFSIQNVTLRSALRPEE